MNRDKYILYARKSTDVEDKQVLSIQSQLSELRSYAKTENLLIVDEIVEKKSAKSPGRPLFDSMMEKIDRGEANGILSWNPDRLARNSVDGGRIIYLLDCGKIVSLKFPTFWFEPTPQGKFMLNLAFGQSKYYVDALSENTKRGLRQKVRRGEYPSHAPLGYINDSRTKTIHVHKKNARIVKQAFQMYATGEKRLQDIADFLSECGIRSRTGKRAHINRVTFMLHNPFYYGYFRYTGELFKGIHQPVISKKLFDQVQAILDRRCRPHKKPAKYQPRKLCGLLHCTCGMMITGEKKTKYQKNGNIHHYIYYHCTRKSKHIKCSEPAITEPDLSRQLSNLIKQPSLPTDWTEYLTHRLDDDRKDSAQSVSLYVAKTKKKIMDIDLRLQRLLDGYLDQVIDQDVYRKEKSKLMSRKESLTENIHDLQHRENHWVEPMSEWIMRAGNLPKISERGTLLDKKSAAIDIYGSNLLLSASVASGEPQHPWDYLLGAKKESKICKKSEKPAILERVTGIEPVSQPWKGRILPLNYTR